MVKLVISWWGDYTDSKKIDDIYKVMLAGKRILYIPWAMHPESYPWCLEWIQNTFPISDWYTVHLLSEEEFTQSNEDYVQAYDGIYMWWGNTYRLLKLLRNTWFTKVIEQFIGNDKPIYWWSAGAIIMWKEIHTAPDMNAVKLSFEETAWYDMCKGFSIACHHNEEKNNEISDYIVNYHIPVICLPEGTGIIYEGNTYTIQWEKSAYIIDINGKVKDLPLWSII
jgi:peptidase E